VLQAGGSPAGTRRLPEPAAGVLSIAAMIASPARYYFWFYWYPKPQAEEGLRSV
jgi:hypothetical protein